MRSPVVLLTLVSLTCTSRPSVIQRAPSAPAAIIPGGTTTEVRLSRDDRGVEVVIPASRGATWAAARALYTSLGVPLSQDDAHQGLIATATFNAPPRFLDHPLSDLLDCGQTMGGARVNLWGVRMELATAVRAEPEGGARVGTLVTAHARTRDGTSTAAVPCSSTGQLEREVARRIREGVGP
jgi:hypothetical protein